MSGAGPECSPISCTLRLLPTLPEARTAKPHACVTAAPAVASAATWANRGEATLTSFWRGSTTRCAPLSWHSADSMQWVPRVVPVACAEGGEPERGCHHSLLRGVARRSCSCCRAAQQEKPAELAGREPSAGGGGYHRPARLGAARAHAPRRGRQGRGKRALGLFFNVHERTTRGTSLTRVPTGLHSGRLSATDSTRVVSLR